MKTFLVKILLFIILFNNSLLKAEINVKAKTAILQDYLSGKILYEKDSDIKIYPASMTKIMTTIVAFDLLKNGEISLDEKFLISKKAWSLSNPKSSSMFIVVDDEVSVENLLRGVIVVSGNDACVALAEGISGSEDAFVELMNAKAKEIGMQSTKFGNSHGLNTPPAANFSTVSDILIMSNYLIKHYPEYYNYFGEEEFSWDRTGGNPITQPNTNTLVKKNIGVDGIKTGFLTVEKYSLASSLRVGERRINAVGSGFKTKNLRSKESAQILTWGLRNFDSIKIAKKNEIIGKLNVWLGRKNKVEVVVAEDIYLTIKKRKKKTIKAVIEYNGPIQAPIAKGDKLGLVNIYIAGELKEKYDIFAQEEIRKANIFSRLLKSFNFLVWGDA